MARTAAIELIKHRIRVNIVHPGWINTPGRRKFFSEEVLHRAGGELPLGRLGEPEEIARGILFSSIPRRSISPAARSPSTAAINCRGGPNAERGNSKVRSRIAIRAATVQGADIAP